MKLFMSAVCALGLAVAISGCATSEEEFIIQKGITDERVDLTGDSDFGLKNLEVFSKTDDNGLLNADVTIEISRTTFWYWVFHGDPLLKLAYRFDWIDNQDRADSMPWQYTSALPGNILRFHGIAPAEKYTSFKLFVQFCKEGETLANPATEAASAKEIKPAVEKNAEQAKAVTAPAAAKKAEAAPVKTEFKKVETAVKADIKKVEAEAKAEVRKVEAKADTDVKKAETATKADIKKVEAEAKAEVRKIEAKADADVKKAETAVKTDIRKVEAEAKAEVRKIEAKADADVKKAETAAKADEKKVEAEAKAEIRKTEAKVDVGIKKMEKELKKEEGKLTESFY